MLIKKSGAFWGTIVLVIFVVCFGRAETERVSLFKGVEFSFDFKSGDIIVEQGIYDLEIYYSKVDTNFLYFLRIMKKGKNLYVIPGQRIEYSATTVQELLKDPKIPKEPTLRIKKIPGGNLVNIIFESGKTGNVPFEKAFFRVEQIQK
jgi:hypothetical protein